MTYKVMCVYYGKARFAIWGTFCNDSEKLFLFVSYCLNMHNPEDFYILEEETGKIVKLTAFAEHYGITKDDVKKA